MKSNVDFFKRIRHKCFFLLAYVLTPLTMVLPIHVSKTSDTDNHQWCLYIRMYVNTLYTMSVCELNPTIISIVVLFFFLYWRKSILHGRASAANWIVMSEFNETCSSTCMCDLHSFARLRFQCHPEKRVFSFWFFFFNISTYVVAYNVHLVSSSLRVIRMNHWRAPPWRSVRRTDNVREINHNTVRMTPGGVVFFFFF